MRGKSIKISKTRRMVMDLLYFAKAVPSIPVQRRINIQAVVAARAACANRPQWSAIFTRGYAVVAAECPQLRRAYVKLPWPQFYEYPVSTATIILEREYEGERTLFSYLLKGLGSVQELSLAIRHAGTAPVAEIKDFRRALSLSGLPQGLRRAMWWLALNIGRQRGNYFGTFGVSVYSALNAESLHPLSPLTTLLNYGVIDGDGNVMVRVIYDHRVLDGGTIARALTRLEEVLNGPVLEELRSLPRHHQRQPKEIPSIVPRPISA
ncbi:MAG TPA: hypothetical protein VFB45_26530 [Pseudolabrys sp.]|nr:hypothetical protein [Pseudolabrys sp.]